MAQALALGAILPTAARDGVQKGLRAGARIGPQGSLGRGVERARFDDDTTTNFGEQEALHAVTLAETAASGDATCGP